MTRVEGAHRMVLFCVTSEPLLIHLHFHICHFRISSKCVRDDVQIKLYPTCFLLVIGLRLYLAQLSGIKVPQVHSHCADITTTHHSLLFIATLFPSSDMMLLQEGAV